MKQSQFNFIVSSVNCSNVRLYQFSVKYEHEELLLKLENNNKCCASYSNTENHEETTINYHGSTQGFLDILKLYVK